MTKQVIQMKTCRNLSDTLAEFDEKYTGERVFIIGNGPSLNKTPLEKLNSEFTISMNKISYIYEDTKWRPSFYYHANSPKDAVSTRYSDSNNYIKDNIDLGIPCFINSKYEDRIGDVSNVYYFDKFNLFGENPFHESGNDAIKEMPLKQLKKYWSDNILQQVYHYHSMYGACQLAAFLGFEEVYFVGCDLGIEYKDPHMVFEQGIDPHRFDGNIFEYLNESVKSGAMVPSILNGIGIKVIKSGVFDKIAKIIGQGEDTDHFTSKYFNDLHINDGPKQESEIIKGHIVTKRIYEDFGIYVANATQGGKLEVYERISLNELL